MNRRPHQIFAVLAIVAEKPHTNLELRTRLGLTQLRTAQLLTRLQDRGSVKKGRSVKPVGAKQTQREWVFVKYPEYVYNCTGSLYALGAQVADKRV
jgi:hypothetical protein